MKHSPRECGHHLILMLLAVYPALYCLVPYSQALVQENERASAPDCISAHRGHRLPSLLTPPHTPLCLILSPQRPLSCFTHLINALWRWQPLSLSSETTVSAAAVQLSAPVSFPDCFPLSTSRGGEPSLQRTAGGFQSCRLPRGALDDGPGEAFALSPSSLRAGWGALLQTLGHICP